jgi:hypothetical protein
MRARNIKPGFFKNEELAECSLAARLLFPGLWMMADREGRLEDRPKRLKGEIFPYDDFDVNELLNELQERGFIVRYVVDGNKYIWISGFSRNQNPHKQEKPSVIPPYSGNNQENSGGTPTGKESNPRIPDELPNNIENPPEITGEVPIENDTPPEITGEIPNVIGSRPADSLFSDSLFSDSLTPDSPESGKNETPDSEADDENVPDAPTEGEQGALDALKAIPGYPFSFRSDLTNIRRLKADYPNVSLTLEFKRIPDWMADNPKTKIKNYRLFLRNWVEKATRMQREGPPRKRHGHKNQPLGEYMQEMGDDPLGFNDAIGDDNS